MDEQNVTVVDEPKVAETVVPAPASETKVEVPVAAPVEVVDEVHFEGISVETPVEDFPVATPKPKKTRKPRTKKVVKTKTKAKAKGKTKTKKSKLGRGHKICSSCGKGNGPRAFRCKFCGHKFKMNVEPKNRTIKTTKVRKNRRSKK